MNKFDTQEKFLDEIVTELGQFNIQSEAILQAIREGFRDADCNLRNSQQIANGGLNLRVKNWILREEDLPFIETIGTVSTAITALMLPEVAVSAVLVTALSSFTAICWQAWRKGATLSKAEVAVLGFLQVHGPILLEDLVEKAAASIDDLSEDDVKLAIQSLTDVEFRDGDIVELVRRDESGRWRVRSL